MLSYMRKNLFWYIWGVGLFSIGVTDYISHRKYVLENFANFLFVITFSSIPFAALALYSKNVLMGLHRQINYELSGICVAFVFTLVFGVWSFAMPIDDAFNPSGFFWTLGFGTICVGYFVGKLLYLAADMLNKSNKN